MNNSKLVSRKSKLVTGFTLIELLVVVTIISVLAGLVTVNFVGARERARDAGRKSNLRQLKSALQLYYSDYSVYPDQASSNTDIAGCGASGTTACGGPQAEFSAGSGPTVYIGALPDEFAYYPDVVNDDFMIKVVLENESDEDIAASQARCSHASCAGATDYCLCAD
jgi:prepilin-type N-terminal cleavage/methylation domain-containing protein